MNFMYQPPTIFDFQRNLDMLIHSGQHQARAAAVNVKSDHASRGLSDSTTVITMYINSASEIHQDIIRRAMEMIADFCSRSTDLSPGGLAGTARNRLDAFGTFLLTTIPRTSFTQEAQRFRNQYTNVFRQRLDAALRDIQIGFIGGRKIETAAAEPPPIDAAPPTITAETKTTLTDIVILRPTFMGMGLDLTKAWDWVRQKGRRLRRH
jgi:hypothetical protein